MSTFTKIVISVIVIGFVGFLYWLIARTFPAFAFSSAGTAFIAGSGIIIGLTLGHIIKITDCKRDKM